MLQFARYPWETVIWSSNSNEFSLTCFRIRCYIRTFSWWFCFREVLQEQDTLLKIFRYFFNKQLFSRKRKIVASFSAVFYFKTTIGFPYKRNNSAQLNVSKSFVRRFSDNFIYGSVLIVSGEDYFVIFTPQCLLLWISVTNMLEGWKSVVHIQEKSQILTDNFFFDDYQVFAFCAA